MKRNRILLYTATLSLLITSCKKDEWLNPKPTTVITDLTVFDTPDRILNQVNGLYANLKTGNFLGNWYQIVSEIRTGEFHCTNMNAATGSAAYSMLTQSTTSEVEDIWNAGYQVINKCNVFLKGLDEKGSTVIDEDLANTYRAEARFVRAVSYYYLLQLYARPYWDGNGSKPGLPLRLKANVSGGNYDLARSTVGETYAQILEDLNFAEDNLKSVHSSAFLNTTRAHKNSAIAFKTRVYLSMRDYSKVIVEANKLVPINGPYATTSGVTNKLEASYADIFKAPYTSSESIFSLPFTNNDSPGPALARYFLPGTGDGGSSSSNGAGEYSLNKVEGVVSSTIWSSTDSRRALTITGPRTNKIWLSKFYQASPHIDYAPIIRYSEVLLNLAESISRTSNTIDARSIALFNAVYGRSNAGARIQASLFVDVNDYWNRILEERRIEFLGEGIRGGDIMRLGLSFPAKSQHAFGTISASDPAYIFPIPNRELTLNNLMVNN